MPHYSVQKWREVGLSKRVSEWTGKGMLWFVVFIVLEHGSITELVHGIHDFRVIGWELTVILAE